MDRPIDLGTASPLLRADSPLLAPIEGDIPPADKTPTEQSFFGKLVQKISFVSTPTQLDVDGAQDKARAEVQKKETRVAERDVKNAEAEVKKLTTQLEALKAKKEKLEGEGKDTSTIEASIAKTQPLLVITTEKLESKQAYLALLKPAAEDDSVHADEGVATGSEGSGDDLLLDLDSPVTAAAPRLPGEMGAEEEGDVAAPVKANIDVVKDYTIGTMMGADYSDIVLNEKTVEGPALRAALKSHLLVTTTGVISTTDRSAKGGNVQELAKKGVEIGVHNICSFASEITGMLILLPAVGLDHLVGSLEDVQETYNTMTDKLGGTMVAKGAARVIQAAHFLAWVVKNIAVLTASGLTIAINSILFGIDKIVSGTVALIVNGAFNLGRFMTKSWKAFAKTAIGAAVLAAIGYGLYAFATSTAAAAAGAGLTVAAPWIGAAIGGLLALYLVVRGVRYVHDHGFTLNGFKNDIVHTVGEANLSENMNTRGALAQSRASYEDEDEARVDAQDKVLTTFYGSDSAVDQVRSRADSTHYRVMSQFIGAKDGAKAFGRDLARTLSFHWNAGAKDISRTDRALMHMSDEQMAEAVADYKVSATITSKENQNVVKAAHLAALKAAKALAQDQYLTTLANDAEKAKDAALILTDAQRAEARTIVHLLSGTDEQILANVNKYTFKSEVEDITGKTVSDLVTAYTESEESYESDELEIEENFEAYTATHSTTIANAIAEQNVEVAVKEVEVKRELAKMEKEATAMVSALFENRTGVRHYLESKGFELEFNEDLSAVTITTPTGEQVVIEKPTKEAPFNTAAFGTLFDVDDEYEYSDESILVTTFVAEEDEEEEEIAGVVSNQSAVELLNAYNAYNALGTIDQLGHLRKARAVGAKEEAVEVPAAPSRREISEPQDGHALTEEEEALFGRPVATALDGETDDLVYRSVSPTSQQGYSLFEDGDDLGLPLHDGEATLAAPLARTGNGDGQLFGMDD